MAKIYIEGIEELFDTLDTVQRNDILRPPVQRGIYRLQAGMAKYPLQKPGSSYIRTGTLGRRWTTNVTESADGITGTVGNNTPYGPWVQSSAFQARMHQGRWQTDQEVADKEEPAIVRDFEQTIQEALDK